MDLGFVWEEKLVLENSSFTVGKKKKLHIKVSIFNCQTLPQNNQMIGNHMRKTVWEQFSSDQRQMARFVLER